MITLMVVLCIWVLLLTVAFVGMLFRLNDIHTAVIALNIAENVRARKEEIANGPERA